MRQIGAAALADGFLPGRGDGQTARSQRLLFLDGTGFLGSQLVHAALARTR